MATYTESNKVSDIVRWEQDKAYSREEVTIASGQNLAIGTVLGKVTSSGEYTQINFSATDGSEDAAGILLGDVDASSGAAQGVALVRDSIVITTDLVWPSGATEAQKNQALAQLKELGIVTRPAA